MKKKGPPPSNAKLFLTGFAASIGIYSVFYLKSYPAVHTFIAEYQTQGVLFAGIALMIVASLSGCWAFFCESTTFKSAFLTGLSFPGLLFGASLGFGDTRVGMNHEATNFEGRFAYAGFVPSLALLPSARPSAPGAAFQLVFNPVGTVLSQLQQQIGAAHEQLNLVGTAAANAFALLESQTNVFAAPPAQTNGIRVVLIRGDVEVTPPRSELSHPARLNEILPPGSKIATRANGAVMLSSETGKIMISALTVFQLRDTASTDTSEATKLFQGLIFYRSRKGSTNDFNIHTPTATASIRG